MKNIYWTYPMNFKPGDPYSRSELRDYLESGHTQQGILWSTGDPPLRPDEIILTTGGRHGKAAGYGDHELEPGVWVYYGQGTTGDHDPERKANKLLVDGANRLLLFTTHEPSAQQARKQGNHKKSYIFEGVFQSVSWSFYTPGEGPRKGNKLLRCVLVRGNPATESGASKQDKLKKVDSLLNQIPNDPESWELVRRRARKFSTPFREAIMDEYDGMCAITGEVTKAVLEAAHVIPHSEGGDNDRGNGILLRSDLHNLFDAGLLKIDSETLSIKINQKGVSSERYTSLEGTKLRRGRSGSPDKRCLAKRTNLG